METTYKFRICDNGYILEDLRSVATQVVEEKQSDKEHRKIKNILGGWLYEDINEYLDEIENCQCEVEIKFRILTNEQDEYTC